MGTIRSTFCRTVVPTRQPAMKFSLVAALIVVLALAQGSRAAEAPEVEKMRQFIEDMKNQVLTRTQTLMSEGQTQLEPLAAQIQEQLKPLASSIEEQLKPLAENMQAQLQPLLSDFQAQMQELLRKVTEQTKSIGN